MDITVFVKYIKLLEPCIYYQEPSDNWQLVLDYFDCPKAWQEPIRVMADGWSYYGATIWYAKYVDPTQRDCWMDEYWEAA